MFICVHPWLNLLTPRPYQLAALDALDTYLAEQKGNPCIVLPTGAGKTPTMAWAVKKYVSTWPKTRIIILAHIRELLEQGVEKMRTIWPAAPIGVYSAGLGSRDRHYNITYASIQSVFKRGCDFDPFDLIFIDEAHRIPLEQDGQYRRFIDDCKLCNPKLRVVGWTATPYRLAGGAICHKDYVLNDIIYEANVKDLIEQGYLCRLRTKIGVHEIDTNGVHRSKGDFKTGELEQRAMVDATVDGIAAEAVELLNRENRRAVLFFCVTVDHAEKFSRALAALGVTAPTIHAKTSSHVRSQLVRDFAAGRLRGLCNVNVLSEGFDAQRIDAVVLVRPTESMGLYYQQVGRGLRTHPDKTDCLVLDFAGNIVRHGPIDLLQGDRPQMTTCGGEGCREHFPSIIGACPQCGWKIPPEIIDPNVLPKGGGERIIPTDPKARVEGAILSDQAEPWEMPVKSVAVKLHEKPGRPASLCVTYQGDFESHREWVCLSHPGFAGHKAKNWWRARFGDPVPESSEAAIASNLFLADAIAEVTDRIVVRQAGKYSEVVAWKFKNQMTGAIAK